MTVNTSTVDPAKTSLPLQVGGILLLIFGSFFRHWVINDVGLVIHLAGDAWFFFQLHKMGFL